MFNRILGLSILLLSLNAFGACASFRQGDFSIAARDSTTETFDCTDRFYPYFSQVNYTIEQGITCNNESWPGKVVMNCENRSHQERDVKNVTLLCCSTPSG